MYHITCNICNKDFKSLGSHLWLVHNITIREYKSRFPGVITSCQETKDLRKATMIKNHGVENPMQSEAIQKKAQETCLIIYGVTNPMKNEEVIQKARIERENTFFEKYGVIHNMYVPEFAEKSGKSRRGNVQSLESNQKRSDSVKNTFQELYGVSGPGGLTDRVKAGMLLKHGAENPSQVPELKRKAIKSSQIKPNKPESLINNLKIPLLQCNVRGDFIVQNMETKKLRIPDFIVQGQNKVIEHFGSFDHGPKRTNISCIEHEQEVINWYKDNGYNCLVIWDCTIKNKNEVKLKIEKFIS